MASAGALPPLVVRADAGTRRGAGHVMRGLALARAWRARGGPVHAVTRDPDGVLARRLDAASIHAHQVSEISPEPTDLAATRRVVAEARAEAGRPPWVVVDGPHFDADYRRALRADGARILMIDDAGAAAAAGADVLLNQNIAAEDLEPRCDPETLLLLGPRYALLGPEFPARRTAARAVAPEARRIS